MTCVEQDVNLTCITVLLLAYTFVNHENEQLIACRVAVDSNAATLLPAQVSKVTGHLMS